jgi:hypothetical protein
MKKEYQEHIVSTNNHQVWLHRTSSDMVDRILKNGLRISDNIAGTATQQSYDLERAEEVYRETHGENRDSVIVVKIPKHIFEKYAPATNKSADSTNYSDDKDVTYIDSNSDVVLQRKYVHGWIDRATGEYFTNPYLAEEQKLTEKHFPAEFYGGLEKDILEISADDEVEEIGLTDFPLTGPNDFIP